VPAGPDASVEIIQAPPDVVLAVRGEIDVATCPLVDTAVAEALADGPDSVTLDLAGVSFLGSSGLASLLRAMRVVGEHGARFALRAPSRAVRDLLVMTHLWEMFPID
jgi:anti-anti-sigma factor